MISVRAATHSDAAAGVDVLKASIRELCRLDHQDDPATLERWLRNKTVERFCGWVDQPESFVAVAEVDGEVCGVGAVSATGDLNLCYVRPGNERTGVGRALLLALEAKARAWGLGELRLVSTATARAFYERHGYVATGEERVPAFGLLRDYGYVKVLGGAGVDG